MGGGPRLLGSYARWLARGVGGRAARLPPSFSHTAARFKGTWYLPCVCQPEGTPHTWYLPCFRPSQSLPASGRQANRERLALSISHASVRLKGHRTSRSRIYDHLNIGKCAHSHAHRYACCCALAALQKQAARLARGRAHRSLISSLSPRSHRDAKVMSYRPPLPTKVRTAQPVPKLKYGLCNCRSPLPPLQCCVLVLADVLIISSHLRLNVVRGRGGRYRYIFQKLRTKFWYGWLVHMLKIVPRMYAYALFVAYNLSATLAFSYGKLVSL